MVMIYSSILVYTYINIHKHTTKKALHCLGIIRINLSLTSVLALPAGVFPMSLIQTRHLTKAHWGVLQAARPAAFMQN